MHSLATEQNTRKSKTQIFRLFHRNKKSMEGFQPVAQQQIPYVMNHILFSLKFQKDFLLSSRFTSKILRINIFVASVSKIEISTWEYRGGVEVMLRA